MGHLKILINKNKVHNFLLSKWLLKISDFNTGLCPGGIPSTSQSKKKYATVSSVEGKLNKDKELHFNTLAFVRVLTETSVTEEGNVKIMLFPDLPFQPTLFT